VKDTVGVIEAVEVPVEVLVRVGTSVGEDVYVLDNVTVRVWVDVEVIEAVVDGVAVSVDEGIAVEVAEQEGVAVGVGEAESVTVGDAEGVDVDEAVGTAVWVSVGLEEIVAVGVTVCRRMGETGLRPLVLQSVDKTARTAKRMYNQKKERFIRTPFYRRKIDFLL
jgi:hypothetical protein